MKKIYIACLILFIFAGIAAVSAEERPLVAVFDFSTNRVSEDDMKTVTELITNAVFKSGDFSILDASRRDALLKEQKFALSGQSDEESKIQAGKLLSAEFIITGSLSVLDKKYVMTVKIIDTTSSLTTRSTKGSWDSISELADSVDTVVAELLDKETEAEEEKTSAASIDTGKLLKWSLAGGGTVFAAAGTILIINGISGFTEAYSAYQDASNKSTPDEFDTLWAGVLTAEQSRNTKAIIGFSAIGVGAAMAGTAAWLFFSNQSPDDAETGPQLEQLYFNPVKNGISLGGKLSWK